MNLALASPQAMPATQWLENIQYPTRNIQIPRTERRQCIVFVSDLGSMRCHLSDTKNVAKKPKSSDGSSDGHGKVPTNRNMSIDSCRYGSIFFLLLNYPASAGFRSIRVRQWKDCRGCFRLRGFFTAAFFSSCAFSECCF